MKLNGCYACGTGTPRLIPSDDGYVFQCVKCKCKTKKKNLYDAQQDWNNGIVYTGKEYWELVFGKGGADNG